jgi:hypothetical protein
MKSREFIQDSALDDMFAQVKEPEPAQPKLPYNQSKVGNFIGKAVAGTANLAGQGVKGLGGALGAGFGKSMASGSSFGGPAGAAATSEIPYQPNKIDPKVAGYLKQATKGQPLKQGTGNTEFDAMLKNAGLLT